MHACIQHAEYLCMHVYSMQGIYACMYIQHAEYLCMHVYSMQGIYACIYTYILEHMLYTRLSVCL